MNLRGARAVHALRCAALWVALVEAASACDPKAEARAAIDPTEPAYDSTAGGDQRVGGEPPRPASGCRSPRQVERVWVDLGETLKLSDFERVRDEALLILMLLEQQLCRLPRARDREGSLRAALGAGLQLEITAIHFKRKDAYRADAHVRLASSAAARDGSATDAARAELVDPPSWVLALARESEAGWRILSTRPK